MSIRAQSCAPQKCCGLLLKLVMDLIGHMYRYLIKIEMLSFIYQQFLNIWKTEKKKYQRFLLQIKRQIVSALGQFAPMEI